MKKIFAILMVCAMLCAAVLPMTVSAAGMVLFQDKFDSMDNNDWMWDGTLFEVVDGRLEGYAGAVVQQSNYSSENDGIRKWGTGTSFAIDAMCLDDDRGNGDNFLALWWADYFKVDEDDESTDSRIVYRFGYKWQEQKYFIDVEYQGEDGLSAEYSENKDGERVEILIDGPEYKMDVSKPDVVRLGMKIDNGVISCYDGNKLIYAYNAERGALCGTGFASPILLWNNGSYCAFDNFIVTTADYNLFNESASDTTAPVADDTTKAADETSKVETKTVVVTDENGEAHTEIVTEIVTNAPKQETNNNGGNSNNGGAQTGDMAVIVVAVMVVALGAAIVVKKVNA